MNHPIIASANAKNRFNDLLKDAQNHRRRRGLRGIKHNPINFLTSLIQILNGLLPKNHREAVPDKMAAVKP